MDINNLDIAQKIGQVIMPRIDFNDPNSIPRAKRLVQECEVGGFIIFNAKRDLLKETTSELQSLAKIPLLLGCDAERGVGQIVSDMTLFPFTMSLGAADDLDLVYNQASFIAKEMKECGLNLLFAPIADINSNPDNPIINMRSYGDDPDLVSRLCAAFIQGAQDNGVLACAKHFPGHGRTGVDSHVDLPILHTALETLQDCDLIPFQRSIEAGVASIMTAHIAFQEIGDGSAVTISNGLISDVLRDEMGFQGLVITDSLHMEGIIKLGSEEYLANKALNAGCDIILDPQDPITLVRNLNSSELDLSILNPRVERLLSIKEEFLTRTATNDIKMKVEGHILKDRIARESVCLVRGETLGSKKAIVYTFDVTNSENEISSNFCQQLEDNGISLHNVSVSLDDADIAIENIPEDFAIICLVYTTIGAWKKQSILPDNFKSILKNLASLSNERVLISFGSPYIIRDFDNFKSIICSFDILNECQLAVADVLLGKYQARGYLPINLDQ
jgi:beta-N-acetylhexosaminidase